MSDIPRARDILLDVAHDLHMSGDTILANRVYEAIKLMTRKSPIRRAPRKHSALTAQQKFAVRAFILAHPHTHLDEVARIFNVNPGRISECLNGGKND